MRYYGTAGKPGGKQRKQTLSLQPGESPVYSNFGIFSQRLMRLWRTINWHQIDLKIFEHLIYLINLIESKAPAG